MLTFNLAAATTVSQAKMSLYSDKLLNHVPKYRPAEQILH